MRGALSGRSSKTGLAELLRHSRYEVIPTAKIEDGLLEAVPVPTDVTITVTASPAKGLEPTLDLAERLSRRGYSVVPHVAARLVRDAGELKEITARMLSAGIKEVFVPAGDSNVPAGSFEGALSLLEELSELPERFERVGITGYPESHPKISDDVTIQSMWDKRRQADYLVSNLCFDQKVLSRWIRRVRERGVTLPMYVGIAGPIETTKLASMATKIGVSESSRFAAGHLKWFARLATPGAYDPGRLLAKVWPTLVDPAAGVSGLHVFTFNQVAETEAWRRSLL